MTNDRMQRTNIRQLILAASTLLTLGACSSEGGSDSPTPPTPLPGKIPIHISATIGSRATDEAFETGDKIGIFVVNYNANGSASNLATTGNHIDNWPFSYRNGTWDSTSPIYWKDETTHADFYLYSPYMAKLSSVQALAWNVKADQSSSNDYKASDLLIGTSIDVAPTSTTVPIIAKHVMSQMIITLVAGKGFTTSSLASSNVQVRVNHLKNNATVNLSTGEVIATGDFTAITPLKENGKYKAIIIPQVASQAHLITVNVDGKEYNLAKADDFKGFEAGKSHEVFITLDKTNDGVNTSITKWENDDIDYGGVAEYKNKL